MKKRKPILSGIVLATLIAAVFICMIFANKIQTNSGKVDIVTDSFETEINGVQGNITYKLYVPETATEGSPAPAVLLLHGYQNDKETCGAYAIELARRGAVVLAIDEYGHGSTDIGLINRGYVNHKVTVNFGEDSEADGTYVAIGGANRYKLMMNFSNLSFFNDKYSKDDAGNAIDDSSCGGIAAYAFMSELPYVDNTRMAVSGHSMGTWSSWSVAAAYSGTDIEPRATVLQCGELFTEDAYDSENILFNNVLLLQAKYDEFSYFRDYERNVDDSLLTSSLRTGFLGCTASEAVWDTTYGSFEMGTARRIELLYTNHRLTTHNEHGLAAALDWFDEAIDLPTKLDSYDQVAMIKEWLVFAAMLCAVFSLLPLMELLLCLPFLKGAAQGLPTMETIKSKGKWWKGAIITMLIATATYPFMTQLGHGLLPLPENIFRMTIGNGFLSWYLLLILIMLGTTIVSVVKTKKRGQKPDYWAMGLGSAKQPGKIGFGVLLRAAVLVAILILYMHTFVSICQCYFQLDFRFIWPFFKGFTWTRLGQFFVYLPVFAIFFILNNSKIMASSRCRATYIRGARGFFGCWWRNALMMVGGILIIILIEYIPFFAGIGPGADVFFGSTFGGPFMSLLIVFAPQVVVFSFLGTYAYRRSGNVYVGALIISSLACWIVTGGSSML